MKIDLPDEIQYETVENVGFLMACFRKSLDTFPLTITKEKKKYNISYGDKLRVLDKALDKAVKKMKDKLKTFNPKISDEEWKEYMDYQDSDAYVG